MGIIGLSKQRYGILKWHSLEHGGHGWEVWVDWNSFAISWKSKVSFREFSGLRSVFCVNDEVKLVHFGVLELLGDGVEEESLVSLSN